MTRTLVVLQELALWPGLSTLLCSLGTRLLHQRPSYDPLTPQSEPGLRRKRRLPLVLPWPFPLSLLRSHLQVKKIRVRGCSMPRILTPLCEVTLSGTYDTHLLGHN